MKIEMLRNQLNKSCMEYMGKKPHKALLREIGLH